MSGTVLGIVAFLLVAGSMTLWFQRIKSVRIPKDRRGFVATWLFAAALGVYALTADPGWLAGIAAGIATFAGLLFTALFFISPQKVGDDAIRVGESLRDFSARDEDGNEFAMATTAGSPVLLKFFRGHW
jgi:hypothetical protein